MNSLWRPWQKKQDRNGNPGLLGEPANNRMEDQFRHILEGIPDYAVFLLDGKGHISRSSGSTEQFFGYTVEELRGKHFSFLYSAEDLANRTPNQELQMASAHGRLEDTTWRVRRDGSRLWTESTLCPVRGEDGEIQGFTYVIRDVTEQKNKEQTLRQKEEELAQARKLEALGRLVGGVAHDFNNFITGIIGLAEETHQSLGVGDPRREDLEEIMKLANRASALTGELLAFGQKQASSPQVEHLNALVEGNKKFLLRLIGADIDLQLTLDSQPGYLLMDPRQFDQILVNLIMNARDAMPKGGILRLETSRTKITETSSAGISPGRYVVLQVSDTGSGMEKEVLERLFEPFFSTKKQGKGTGLGLATVYGIVKQHGGSITVESQPGKGSSFRILWPEVAAPALQGTGILPSTPTVHTETILVVEDEDAVRWIAQRALEKNGYRVLTAASGPAALKIAREFHEPIHLLLTDVVMPELNGRVLAEQFKFHFPKAAVLYMSAYSEDIIHQRGILGPGFNFIKKPFTQGTLLLKVSVVLEKRQERPKP